MVRIPPSPVGLMAVVNIEVNSTYIRNCKCPDSTGLVVVIFNPLNAELNPICHLLALLGAHHIFHVSGLRVKLGSKWY